MKPEILNYIERVGDASPKELADHFEVSRQMMHRYLADLLETGQIIKIGRSPKVFYQRGQPVKQPDISDFKASELSFLKQHFIEITEDGQYLEGIEAFNVWCRQRNLPLRKTFLEYKKTLGKYIAFQNGDGLINGTQKLQNTSGIETIHVHELFYVDFYAIERFGKTRLGKLLHFAKQSQNKALMKKIVQEISQPTHKLIQSLKIEAVGYVPPTISRNIQLMDYLEKSLALPLPHIRITKVKGEIVVPQKALSKIYERVNNARKSIVVTERGTYGNVLLIDDAVGSGATINETAGKILKREVAQQVYALAVTGSFKGFEVIAEA